MQAAKPSATPAKQPATPAKQPATPAMPAEEVEEEDEDEEEKRGTDEVIQFDTYNKEIEKIKHDFIIKLFNNNNDFYNYYKKTIFETIDYYYNNPVDIQGKKTDKKITFDDLFSDKKIEGNIKEILLTDDKIFKINQIKNIKKNYIIIDFLCYSDKEFQGYSDKEFLEKFVGTTKKLKLEDNKSIAITTKDNFDKIITIKTIELEIEQKEDNIEDYVPVQLEKLKKKIEKLKEEQNNIKDYEEYTDKINELEEIEDKKHIYDKIENYVHFLHSQNKTQKGSNDDRFLLIWKFDMYRILNLNYNKEKKDSEKKDSIKDGDYKYIYMQILYRIFYYFLNICYNLDILDNSTGKLAILYKNNYANDIIKQIKLWDKNNTTNSTKYINRKNGIEDILILYDKFFKELIKNIFIIFNINPYDNNIKDKEESLEIVIDRYISENSIPRDNIESNLFYKFFSILSQYTVTYINNYKNDEKYDDANDDVKAIEIYKLYKNICIYEDAGFDNIETALKESRTNADIKRNDAAKKKAEEARIKEATRIKAEAEAAIIKAEAEEATRKKAEAEEATRKEEEEKNLAARKEATIIEVARIKEVEIKAEEKNLAAEEATRMEEETEAEAIRLAERDASNMLLFTVENNLKKVFNSFHYIIRREKMSSGENNISALVQNNLNAVFYKNNEGGGEGEGQEDSRENNISALVQNNLNAVFYKNNEGGGEGEGQEEAILYNFVKEEIPGNDSKEYTILSKQGTEPSYNINELLKAYNYVIHIKGNLIIKYNIQRYYNIRHILKIIYEQSDHIIIISKKKDFDNEGLYQYKSYNKINLIIIYSENILPNFNKLILEDNKLDSTIEEFESIKSKIYGVGKVEVRQQLQKEEKTGILANMRNKIVSVAKKTADVVGRAPKAISNIGSTLLKGAIYLSKKLTGEPLEYKATISFIKLLKSAPPPPQAQAQAQAPAPAKKQNENITALVQTNLNAVVSSKEILLLLKSAEKKQNENITALVQTNLNAVVSSKEILLSQFEKYILIYYNGRTKFQKYFNGLYTQNGEIYNRVPVYINEDLDTSIWCCNIDHNLSYCVSNLDKLGKEQMYGYYILKNDKFMIYSYKTKQYEHQKQARFEFYNSRLDIIRKQAPAPAPAPAAAEKNQDKNITDLVQTNLIGVFSYLQKQKALEDIITIIKDNTETTKIDPLISKFTNIAPEYEEKIYKYFEKHDLFLLDKKYSNNNYFKTIKIEQTFNYKTFKQFFTGNNLLDIKYVNDDDNIPTIFKLMTQRTESNNEILIRLSKNNLDGDRTSSDDNIKIFEIDLINDKLSYTNVTNKPFEYYKTNPPSWYTRHNPQSTNNTTTTQKPFIHILINELKDKKDKTTKYPPNNIVEHALIEIIEHIVAIATLSRDTLISCKKHLIEIIGNIKLIEHHFDRHIVSRGKIENKEEYKWILKYNSTKITHTEKNRNYKYMDFLNGNPVLKKNNMIVRLFYSESYKHFVDIIVKIIDNKPYIFPLIVLYPRIVLYHNYDITQTKLTFSVISYEKIYDVLVSNITDFDKTIYNINYEKFAHITTRQDMGKQRQYTENYIAYIIIYNPLLHT